MGTSAWDDVCNRWTESGYDALSPAEKTWVNVRSLIDSIEDGGVVSYFYNSGADTVGDCLADLQRLGADAARLQVERVCALFTGEIPRDTDERNAVLDAWPEEDEALDRMLDDVDEHLVPLMPDLEARLDRFLVDSGLAAG